MASGGAEEDDGGSALDIDNVHMLLQVEHEQIQKRTFTNWINAQISKRCPPSFVSDLFSDLRDGSQLLDLLEVMSGQPMVRFLQKRQRGRGVFQQRANVETALTFLKKKSIKLVNINVSDITEGRPSIILGLIWTIILHCHIEELASNLSFSSRHSSLDSLASLDSWSGSPVPASLVPAGRTSPLHSRFRVSAKKALLMWVRDQCQRAGCSISVRDFRSSWRSGEAFLAILCSLRPHLVDLSLAQTRSNQENLEEAFHLAERELHIPRLLEPQDVDVKDPEEKSIITYVAQFLQYSNDMPAPDDHLQLFPLAQPSSLSPVNFSAHFTPAVAVSPLRQVSPVDRALEVTSWLQQAYQELSESRMATEESSFAEKYQVFQDLANSFAEQRRPVMTLLAAIKRRPELSQEQRALRTAWDRLEEELQRCKAELDLSLPPPLDSVVLWLQRAETALREDGGEEKDHHVAAKEARVQQDTLKTIMKDMSRQVNILDTYQNTDDAGNAVVPLEKFNEIKRRFTSIQVTAVCQGVKLEYQECRHTVLDLLRCINAKVQTWKAPFGSQETVHVLLQDWHETVERQGILVILMDALQSLKDKANTYTSKAVLGEDAQRVTCQVKEAESEAELVTQAVTAVRGTMERVVSAWETYKDCMTSLQTWLGQKIQSHVQNLAGTQDISEWTSCQAKLNHAGNFLIEVTESSTSLSVARQLSKVNMQWAECMKRAMFEVPSGPSVGPPCLQTMHSLTQEASRLLRQPVEVASVALKANRQKIQLLSKKMADMDLSSLSSSSDFQASDMKDLLQTLPQMLAEAERTCGALQSTASRLEGCLAELDRWNTDSLDCQQHLKETKYSGRSALGSTARALVARGWQLQSQVVTEGQDLLDLVAQVQKTSPLQHFGTSRLLDRISKAVSRCQDVLGVFSSLGFQQRVEAAHHSQRQTEAGLFVVARTKHVDEVGNVTLQSQDPNQVSPESLSERGELRKSGLELWREHQHMQPRLLEEAELCVHPPLDQSVKEADAQTPGRGPNAQPPAALTQSPVGPTRPKGPAPVEMTPVPDEKEGSSASQAQNSKSRIRRQPNTPQSLLTSPQALVLVRGEVHSKAQSMARSRLEKARYRLQGRIQQAIKLFGGKEMTESQAKRKQRALKILQPTILEEFLDAVEGFGAFCTGPQVQDLKLLSASVRNQWEDVRREIAAFVPILWSKIRKGGQPFSAVQCETQANTLHEATDRSDLDSLLHPQEATSQAASAEVLVESLQELCETLTPVKSSCLATDQLRESDEAQESRPGDTGLPYGWGGAFQENAPPSATSTSANTQHSNNLPQELPAEHPQPAPSPEGSAVSAPLRHAVQGQPRGVAADSIDELMQRGGCGSGRDLRAEEPPLRARLLTVAENHQHTQTHLQALVEGSSVETKQEAEWTVVAAAPPREEHSSGQELQERYRKSHSLFLSQLEKNRQHLEKVVPHPGTVAVLQHQGKQLQALKQDTEALWLELELQYAQFSQFPQLMTRDHKVERDWEQLTQQWKGQQMCLQSRMTSVGNTAALILSADDQIALIKEGVDRILRESVDISSFTLSDPRLLADLKEMDDRLLSEMKKLSERATEEEMSGLDAASPPPLCLALHDTVHHLEQLRQRLEKVESAARALDHFLATAREVEAGIPTLLAKRNPSRQPSEAGWEQEGRCWQAAAWQKLHTAAEQSGQVDSFLRAVGMTLALDGVTVTCQDVVTSLSRRAMDMEKELIGDRDEDRKGEPPLVQKEQTQDQEELSPVQLHETGSNPTQEWEHPTPRWMEEESQREAKRSRPDGETAQRHEEHKAEILKSGGDVLDTKGERRKSSSQVKADTDEEKSLNQRRVALLCKLRELKEAAEQLGLQEPTLPALQQRTRALTELESRLAGHLPELQLPQHASSQDVGASRELEDVWQEATQAVAERLEHCRALTELLKRFQSTRGELSATLHRAEGTIGEQASYMGKANICRLHTKVEATKAELNGLGDGIEEVRSVCRQLHTQLRHIPECNTDPFEGEADALMDRWLDVSERTDSHIENLHLGLTLWDGALQLASGVESWTANKLAAFAQSPSFHAEEDITSFWNDIAAQEENMERFRRRAAEIQALLQSTEPPLELQVVESQTRKSIRQLKELVSEAEDVYRQMVAAKGQITARMAECSKSLQKIQDSLLRLSGSEVSTVLTQLKDLLFELQTQDEQAEGLLQDLHVLTSVESSFSLESLSVDGIQLQDKVKNTHQLFSEVEEQTERNIQTLDTLQRERERLEQWLQGAEERAAKEEDLHLLREEALHQRERAEALDQLVSSLQSSPLRQTVLVKEGRQLLERYNNFQININLPCGSTEGRSSVGGADEGAQTLSPQSWTEDARQIAEPPLGENFGNLSADKQILHGAQPMPSVLREAESFLEESRVTGNSLGHRQDDQTTERQRTDQSVQPPDSSWVCLKCPQGVCSCLGQGVSNEEHFGQLLHDCHHKLTSLQETMSGCQTQKENSAGQITDVPTLEDLPLEKTDVDEELSQIGTFKDSIAAGSTAEARASLPQQADHLQNHKRALEGSISDSLTLLTQENIQRVQLLGEEVPCLQTALKDLAEILGNLCENREGSPDVRELKHKWETLQDCETQLTELAARFNDLKRSGASGITQKTTPAGVLWTADAASKELDGLWSVLLERKRECAESTANRTEQVISQLLKWSQTVQSESSSPEQATLDEGLGLQQTLHEMISDQDFLQNCLGRNVAEKLQRNASDALSDSELATLSHCVSRVSPSHCEVELDKRGEETGSEASCLRSPDETPMICSAINNKGSSKTDQFDNTIKTEHVLETAEEEAFVPQQDPCATTPDDDQNKSQRLTSTPPKLNLQTFHGAKETTGILANDNDQIRRLSVNNTEPAKPGPLQKSCIALQDSSEPADDTSPGATTDNLSEITLTKSDAFLSVTDGPEQVKEEISQTPKKDFSIVLDLEPKNMQENDNNGPDALRCSQRTELCDAELTGVSSTGPCEKKSELRTTLVSAESAEAGLESASQSSHVADALPETPSVCVNTDLGRLEATSVDSPCKDKSRNRELMQSDVMNSSDLCSGVAECQPTGARAEETTFLHVKQEAMTDICHAEEQTISSALCTAVGTEIQKPDHDHIQLAVADAARGTHACDLVMAERQNTEESTEPECLESKSSEVPERQDRARLPEEQAELKTEENMEPERRVPGLAADLPAGETTGGSPECFKHKCSMQDILSEIQSLVETSNIINRTPHIDLNWYLELSPGEPQIQLARTVQKVLACRYQPAQLDVNAMAGQLQEAEDYRCCVQEQVATMKTVMAAKTCEPDALKRVQGQWSAALLDASATVQVKATQLDQVKEYHKQMRLIRAFLEVLAVEKVKMTLNALGSSTLQADKLHALLQTMMRKKDAMEELLHLSSQLSVHLSDAESSGCLLAQLGDVQEEWRLLEGSIKRALQHASIFNCQHSLLIKDAEQLKSKLEAVQRSNFQSQDNRSTLENVCLTSDLKLYNQLYVGLQSQSDALVHFSLGQKEKDEIKRSLQELGSLLSVTKSKLDIFTYRCGGISLANPKTNKQLQDLIIWAKQAESYISVGQKLALFPEEARLQIVEMKKFQTEFWCRRSKMQAEVEQMKDVAPDTEKNEINQVLKTTEELYKAIADSLDDVLDIMKNNLEEREKLFNQLAKMDAWLAETHAKGDPCSHVDSVLHADIRNLEGELKSHKIAKVEIQNQLKLVEAMTESWQEKAAGLSPAESRYLVNRLSGLWTELDGLLAHEKATSWELEELILERTTSDEELSHIQASLHQLSTDLEQQSFPLTQETISMIEQWKHMLMEHQCEVQELQHCQEAKRSSVLCTVGELQDQCKALIVNAFEQDKYLHLRGQMEESRDIAKEQIQHTKDQTISVDKRFKLCQTLLVELPLVKTQCQEAADQLEAIAMELCPSELDSERQRICQTVETLVSWESSITDDLKNLENKLLIDLCFSSEFPAAMEFFQRIKVELEASKPANPDEKVIDIALRRYWVIWRNIESCIRVLEGLGLKDNINLRNYKELYALKDGTKQECHLQMESLSQARESLKDYQWAAQGAIGFLHNAEATFLTAPGGFLDCTEEQRQTQQALEALEDGFQAHISHLSELFPQQPCLCRPDTEQLHITILSQLLVGRAVLEAQAQLRLESLQRCEIRQQSHKKCHEDLRQRLLVLETRVAECAAEHVTSYDKCVAQQNTAKLLMEDLRNLSGKIEELRAGCPMQGCGVGKDGELGALWRRWVLLRRGVSLLIAHTQQREEEWRDITISIQQCCSFLATLQDDVPDFSTMSFPVEEPQELLAQAEMHQAGLQQGQQALASLEHRLEHALSLSRSEDPISPGPVGKTLVKIQENVRSLKERNQLVVAAAQAEEKERQHVQEEIEEVEQHMFAILPLLETCSNPQEQKELRMDLSFHKAKLKHISDGVQSRYAEIPADISRRLQEVQLALQREEEKLLKKNNPVWKLDSQVVELGSSLEKVKELLEQRSPTVTEAQRVLKHVWDELDAWHSRLMLLENEVQDLAEDHPDQAHVLMDQLTQPLQLYQNAAQMAEQRTAFLSKIPTCLQEFEGVIYSATCWLDEAQTWLRAPCCFTTARHLQNHANSLQLVLDDSERIRHILQDFRPALDEISAVCDISSQVERLDHNDKEVHKMQHKILQPLENLLHAVGVVEAMEAELKTIEKNVPKIRTILSSMDNTNITPMEHLHSRQVILANVQAMRRTLEEVEESKGELCLSLGAEESLQVFSRAKLLLQPLEELEQLTEQQAELLENKMEEELGIAAVTEASKENQQPDRSPLRRLVREAFDVSNSEEEEDEEDESCHSSSSDTLTCSLPEDPEETLSSSDVRSEDLAEIVPPSEEKTVDSETAAETGLLTKEPEWENVETKLMTMDSEAGEVRRPERATDESLVAAADRQFPAAALDRAEPTTLVRQPQSGSLQPAAAVEDTRLVPVRPLTPFAASDLATEGGEESTFSARPAQDLVSLNVLEEQNEGSIVVLADEPHQTQESSETPTGSTGPGEDEEQRRWSQLYNQISQKLITLKEVQEEHRTLISSEDRGTRGKVPEKELVSTGSASAVLQGTLESIVMLRHLFPQNKNAARCLHPGVSEELYEAGRRVLLCLDPLTDLLLSLGDAGEDDYPLRLLQQECVSTELVTLAELLRKVESETRPALSRERPDASRCLTSLQECLLVVQQVFTSSHNRLAEHLGITYRHQELSNQPRLLDVFEVGQQGVFPSVKDAPSLKQCMLGRHQRESPENKAKLQQASQSLLQGITHLLELGEECITEGQMSRVHSPSRLQAALCRPKKLLQVLRSQLAFAQNLFQREPEALRCQEDERVQLEVRAKALQQQALEQEVASQRRIQEWTRWEGNCDRLSRLLDDAEAFMGSGEPEGNGEKLAQHRLDACQRALAHLDECRVALGLLQDQRKVLQSDPEFAAAVSHVGGALELRWLNASRRAEQEAQRCRDIQDSCVRFQTSFDSLSEWLTGAGKLLKTWSDLANTCDLEQESIHNHLIKLLDLFMETETMSVKRASVSREANGLLHVREADCSTWRAKVTQLEVDWSQLTSDLSKTQDQLQQRLLAAWPPLKLLSDLEDWLKKLEARCIQEKDTVRKARDATQINDILQHYQEIKAGVINGQLLTDFLSQSGPRVAEADMQAVRDSYTVFAEKLGSLRLQWLQLQGELEGQVCSTEQTHRTCADRERRLRRLHAWIEQQKKQLDRRTQPTSQAQAHKTLLELEAVVGRVSEVAAASQELKATRVHFGTKEDHTCDLSFSGQADTVCHAAGDLRKQMDAMRAALQQTVEKWGCLQRALREASLHTTRVHCSLQHQPLFSLKQAEGYMDLLQLLQEQARKGDELWASVDTSYQSLVELVHHGTAQVLDDQMEEERQRWRDVAQELKTEQMKAGRTLSLWQEYSHLSDRCSFHLQKLRHQWEDLWRCSPQENTQTMVKQLQASAENLQSKLGDVVAASKALTGRLEPLAANLIQSETQVLSRDVLLLMEATSGQVKSLQGDLEQRKQFRTRLEALEKQTLNVQNKLEVSLIEPDSEKVLSELGALFASLVDAGEMSGYVKPDNRDAERLHMLSGQWAESMTHMFDRNRELQAERQRSQSFQQKCDALTSIQRRLDEESARGGVQTYSGLKQMLTVQQRLEAEITIGSQLLQALLRHVVESSETATEEDRSELVAQATGMMKSWFGRVALVGQRGSLIKEQLSQWRVFHQGLNLLWKLLKAVDPLLRPAEPAVCAIHQIRSCLDDLQCIKEALGPHSALYARTLEAGRHLCETTSDSESQSRLQSELQDVQKAWERTTSLLERRQDLVIKAVQAWSRCQDRISSIASDLEELETTLKEPLPERPQDSEDEKLIQKQELSLQRLTTGLRELATMKTDLSQYIAAGDSALLEQQLEQLHSQWEELCVKVSSRKQEIADRLNAWTIFNDKNKEFCDWLTQMENKVCHSGDLSLEEMVEKLKKDCMEEINLFSENKSHLKQLGEQLMLASDEAKQTQVRGSLLEVNQRWHNLFHHIEARVKKLKETLVTMQQLDKNMSNLRSWLSRIEAELSRPITYSVCHHQEIQRRLAEQQELQRDIEQHTEGIASVLSLCDVLLRDEDATGGTEAESDSLQETSRSLDQRWRTICAMALDRRLRIEETWRLWCKFLDDYSRFEDWLKMAERTAANPNSADVLYTVAKEELKKFEGFQRQVHERLTQLELVNSQYRRLARENRTDQASHLKATIHAGNRRWDTLHHRVAAILRRLKYFTSQREEFEGTRENMLVWLTELDLQLTNVEHFSESDVHHKIQQLNSFQKEITLNTERIDGLIVFGEGLIQKSSPQDAALIEEELEELHSYCQEVFSRLVRFHQRLSQPPMIKDPETPGTPFPLEPSLELIGQPWLGRWQGILPATPTHLLASPLERSGRETPDSLPLEWDPTGDVGGSSSHEDNDEGDEEEEERTYFSALSEAELTDNKEEFAEAPEALGASSLVSSTSMAVCESPRWQTQGDEEMQSLQLDSEGCPETPRTLTSTPVKPGYLRLMAQCRGSINHIQRVSLILDDNDDQPAELGLTGLTASEKQSGVIERWELLQAQSRKDQHTGPPDPQQLTSDLDDIASWLEGVIPTLEGLQQTQPAVSIEDMAARAKELKEMQKLFARYKSIMLAVNLGAQETPELQDRLAKMNQKWSQACIGLQQWDTSLRKTLMRCQEFHKSLHSLLLWLAHAESRRYAVDINHPDTPVGALQQHRSTLTNLQGELQGRQSQQASLHALWSQLQPEEEAEDTNEAQEKLHVTGSKLKLLMRQVDQDLSSLQQRLDREPASERGTTSAKASREAASSKKGPSTQRTKRDSSPPRSLFYRVLRAAFPLHLLLLFLLLLPCLVPLSECEPGCTGANNFAWSFYPMLRYTNGPPPT